MILVVIANVSATLPFGNRNGESVLSSGLGAGGRRNNPRLPVSPEAYMSSVSECFLFFYTYSSFFFNVFLRV